MGKKETQEKILKTAMSLFSKKGFDGVTTREIAKEARVNELTLFRHFKTKRNIFEKAFDKYLFFPNIKSFFDNDLSWNLEQDLLNISLLYQKVLAKNKRVIQMIMKTSDSMAVKKSPVFKYPAELKNLLIHYFSEMQAQGKIIREEPEIIAMNFIATNFGLFALFLLSGKSITRLDLNACISNLTKVLTRGLTKSQHNQLVVSQSEEDVSSGGTGNQELVKCQ